MTSLLLALAAPCLGVSLGLALSTLTDPQPSVPRRIVGAAATALALGLVTASWLLLP